MFGTVEMPLFGIIGLTTKRCQEFQAFFGIWSGLRSSSCSRGAPDTGIRVGPVGEHFSFKFSIDKMKNSINKRNLIYTIETNNIPTWIFKQTLAVLVNNFLIFGGAAIVTFIVLVYLAFTSYWWVTALYASWYVYDLNSDEDGGWDYRRVECI